MRSVAGEPEIERKRIIFESFYCRTVSTDKVRLKQKDKHKIALIGRGRLSTSSSEGDLFDKFY
ncbi:hypothetical protein QR98_0033730 [Sarcoptes scabiei]|uniref:Uncharacterized protein n=1 Tax=Sarcoptes scabiei TaxID=52283 RepID=A0A132A1J8_SARSC|nr:hypothetical protein QR98_0033730 [Sarcoptes scabiei]